MEETAEKTDQPQTSGETSTETPDETQKSVEFKKPVLIGRVGKLPKAVKPKPAPKVQPKPIPPRLSRNTIKARKARNKPPVLQLKEDPNRIPYKEPKWSGLCPDGSDYALEVLKSGTIVDRFNLTEKPYCVFGRFTNCDVIIENPTASRHHAVLQYKAFVEEGEPLSGWYLYDLKSTHGTYLNKVKLKPNCYTRVRVGHQIKFGTSSRIYVLMGPDFDCEGESQLSVSEIKQKARELKEERDRTLQMAEERREKERLELEKKREEQGIDWGMGEDAEDEPDLSENPYASTSNESLYLEDPKKTLRGYFEREGLELVYDFQDRGVGQYVCRVELPIYDAQSRPVVAEVIHKGKKKEAVIACALEACRILDRAGVLRQAKHESRRRKVRDWSADDYYDSDDDTFLDRTGAVERKRDGRMRKHEGIEPKALTHDDLLKQIKEIEGKIAAEEKCLQRLRDIGKSSAKSEDGEGDSLDEFMSNLNQGKSMAHKADISNSKMALQKLKAELARTQRLADIARPTNLPPLIKSSDSNPQKKLSVKTHNSIVYGKRLKLKEDLERKPKIREQKKQSEEFVEEMDSDDETPETSTTFDEPSTITETITRMPETATGASEMESEVSSKSELSSKSHSSKSELSSKSEVSSKSEISSKSEAGTSQKRVFGPMRPPENYVVPETYFNQETDRDLPEIMEDE